MTSPVQFSRRSSCQEFWWRQSLLVCVAVMDLQAQKKSRDIDEFVLLQD